MISLLLCLENVMKIDFRNINILNNKLINKPKLKTGENTSDSPVSVHYCDIISNYNKANINFKAKTKDFKPIEYKILSYEEYEKLKKRVISKLHNQKIDDIPENSINSFNAIIFDRLLSDDNFKNNLDLLRQISMVFSRSPGEDKPALKVLNKVLSDENLYTNKSIIQALSMIMYYSYNKGFANIKCKVLDFISKNPDLSDSGKFKEDFIERIIIGVLNNNTIVSKFGLEIFKTILSKEKLYNNKCFMESGVEFLLGNTQYEEEFNNGKEALEFICNSDDILNNDKLMARMPHCILDIDTKDQLKYFKKAMSNKRLYSNDFFMDHMTELIINLDIKTPKEVANAMDYLDNEDITPEQIVLLGTRDKEDIEKIIQLYKFAGKETVNNLNAAQIDLALEITYLLGIDKIKKIPKDKLEEFIDFVLSNQEDLVDNSQELRKLFPIIPDSTENYGRLLKGLSGYIKKLSYKPADKREIKEFNDSLFNLGDSLSKLTDEEIDEVAVELRDDKVYCSNKELEEELNKLLGIFPKLKSLINKKDSADKDSLNNSLKTIGYMVKNPEYKKLNQSDKKTLLIAGLLENVFKSNDNDRALKAILYAKKLGLTKEEETKLYNLINNINLYSLITSDISKYVCNSRRTISDSGLDLRYKNSFEMWLILNSIKQKNLAPDKQEILTKYIYEARTYIKKLKETQPLLPTTKFPKANRIDKAITTVNPDGSTNIKGVYKDKDGLIVINYNEVEDWEKIGFPKGTISKGIKFQSDYGKVNTGNLKFFVHGLDYDNQLAGFDLFSLINSDVVLSASYAERPESKFRFFRAQGIIFETNCDNVLLGGDSDGGTGVKKIFAYIRNQLAFLEHSKSRAFISDILKDGLGLNDEQYADFVENNQDKALNDFDKDIQTKIAEILGSMNSRGRFGYREYNEFLITNPKPPMAVYAYSLDKDEIIDNPLEFLNRTKPELDVYYDDLIRRTGFLRNYAISHDIPFVVFGGDCED